MTIEILEPRSRAAWLELRKETIGASEIAALFGVHPWVSALDLWARKIGRVTEFEDETPPMRRGRMLEAVAIDFLREEQPEWVIKANPIPGGSFYRDLDAGLSATPDALVRIPGREGIGICQIKSVEPGVFRRQWKAEDGLVEPPLHVALQAAQEAHLAGAAYALAAPIIVSYGIEMPIIEIPLPLGLFDQIRTKAAEFMQMVAANEMPPIDYAKDGELLASLLGIEEGRTVDLSGQNRLPELLETDERLRKEMAEAKDKREAIKTELVAALGGAEVGVLADWTITNKMQHRKAYSVAETDFPVLRTRRAS